MRTAPSATHCSAQRRSGGVLSLFAVVAAVCAAGCVSAPAPAQATGEACSSAVSVFDVPAAFDTLATAGDFDPFNGRTMDGGEAALFILGLTLVMILLIGAMLK